MAKGMFDITPELEDKGRKGDTEVGLVSVGSVVLPAVIAQDPSAQDLISGVQTMFAASDMAFDDYVVNPSQTEYTSDDNAVQAHLTVGEVIIPPDLFAIDPNFKSALADLFAANDVSINQYTVGNKDNSINPETGLPEFGFGDLIADTLGFFLSPITAVIQATYGVVNSIATSLIGSLDSSFLNAMYSNPLVRAGASALNPQVGQVLGVFDKLVNGGEFTVTDLQSLGLKKYSQAANYKLPTEVTKALKTVEAITNGADPLKTLTTAYGKNFVKTLGIGERLTNGIAEVFDQKTADYLSSRLDFDQAALDLVQGKGINDVIVNNLGTDLLTYAGQEALDGIGTLFGQDAQDFLSERLDLNRAATDIIKGTDPARILANQFGDQVADYLGGTNENLKALAYGGIEAAVAASTDKDPLKEGLKEYYDRGGRLPEFDIGKFGEIAGFDLPSIDWNKYIPEIGIDVPDLLGSGYDWLKANVDLGSLKDLYKGFGAVNFPDLNLSLGEFADLGGDFSGLDWKGFDIKDTDFSLGELKDFGVDLPSLNVGGLSLPNVLITLGAAGQQIEDEERIKPKEEEEIVSLDNPFTEDTGPLLSRQLIESAPIG